MKDIASNVGAELAFYPGLYENSDSGPAISLAGFESAAFIVVTGSSGVAGDFSVTIEEADEEEGDFTEVAADQIDGKLPETLAESTTYKFGYRGFKSWIRIGLTLANGTSIAMAAICIKGHPRNKPVTASAQIEG